MDLCFADSIFAKKKKGILGIKIPIIDDIIAKLSGLNSAINRAEDNVRHATEEVNRQAAVLFYVFDGI
jgi:hypothetical protein